MLRFDVSISDVVTAKFRIAPSARLCSTDDVIAEEDPQQLLARVGGAVMNIHATVSHNNTTGRRLDFVEQQLQVGRCVGQVVGIIERESSGGGAALIVRLCTDITHKEAKGRVVVTGRTLEVG